MATTFSGGIHPPGLKQSSKDKVIETASLPSRVVIPLSQHTGAPCAALVTPGEKVRTGQKIAEASPFISSPIHASITGTVRSIGRFAHPVLGAFSAVTIERGEETEEFDFGREYGEEYEGASPDELIRAIREAGIVGMGGAMFPTSVKLSVPPGKKVDALLVNGAECEPYLTCDYRLMVECAKDIVKATGIVMHILGVEKAYIGVEMNKRAAAEALRNMATGQRIKFKKRWAQKRIEVINLKVKYPQGAEKQLIKAVLNREIPPKALPFDVGCVVLNVGTLVAIKEAIYQGKPLYERVITFAGSAIKEPKNLMVRMGTLAGDLIGECGGFSGQPAKVLFGGPMMGIAQSGLEVPVIKGTSGVLFLSAKEAAPSSWGPCIRCGKCMNICPMALSPALFGTAVEKERYELAEEAGVLDCVECGACAYSCPFHRPLVQFAKVAKRYLTRK